MTRISQLSRLGLFAAQVPRYTSYPTAAHFTPAIGAAQFGSWLRALPEGGQVSLYVHVPFCRRLCWFCACRTQGTRSELPLRAYLATLKQEIAMLAAALPAGVTLSRLHWGGGTPTFLPAELITELAAALHAAVPLGSGSEFSVEIDPNEIDAPRLDALCAAGMTRASIGVQDFDARIQRTIGRDQSFEITRATIAALRARGVASLNADLVYGLPHQTRAGIGDTVQKLLSLGPDRVALYGYAHVPWMARRQQMIPTESLPRPEERLELFETARRLFVWDGFDEIGIDHFARPGDRLAAARRAGTLRRNFQGYTDDTAQTLIGIGASAISRFGQGYTQNAPATSDYTRAVRAGGFATARGHELAGDDTLRARLIESVMCRFGLDFAALARELGVRADHLRRLAAPVAEHFAGFVDLDDAGFAIRPEGRPLTRMIARGFDAYDLSKSGHSSAV